MYDGGIRAIVGKKRIILLGAGGREVIFREMKDIKVVKFPRKKRGHSLRLKLQIWGGRDAHLREE